MSTKFFAVVIAVAGIVLTGCQRDVVGTSDESVVRSARVLTSDLQPAQDVDVKVYLVDDTLRVPAYQTKTDAAGSYDIKIEKGMYNVLIGDDVNGAFQDSVLFNANYSTLEDDTLGRTGVLRGRTVLQLIDNPQTAVVQVVGTNKYSNVSEDGSFMVRGLPDGAYLLRVTSTKPEYTPTYKGFSINTSVNDTTDIEVELIYTGIPTVRNIRLSYDSLKNEVTLTWDTTSYFLFRAFQIYTIDANGENMQLIGTSDCCKCILNRGSAGNTMNFRVGIQSKSLGSGPTAETVSVTWRGDIIMYFRDTANGTLGKPYTLSMIVENTWNTGLTYEWDIGATGVFAPSGGPDTVFTVSGSLVKRVKCIGRVTVGGSAVFYDTATVSFFTSWEKTGDQTFPQQQITDVVVKDGTLYLFTQETGAWVLWTSTDARTWQKVGTPNLPNGGSMMDSKGYILNGFSRMIVYKDQICMADSNGYLLTSNNGIAWQQGSAPICRTFGKGTLFEISRYSNFTPQLFIVNGRLHVRPNSGTVQGDSVYFSDDLVNWNNSEIRYDLNVGDYAPMGDSTLLCGFSWSMPEWRLSLIVGDSMIDIAPAYQFELGISILQTVTYSWDSFDYYCFNRGNQYYVFTGDNTLLVWDTGSKKWDKIPFQTNNFGLSFRLVMFNGKIIAIGTDGTYTMAD